MSYTKPTLSELIDQQYTNLLSALQEADPELRDSVLSIFAKVFAGGLAGAYSRLEWQTRQMFPNISDFEYAQIWGNIKKIIPLAANHSDGTILIGGTSGSTVPLGTQLRKGDGTLFETTVSALIPASGSLSVATQAVEAGTIGNTEVDTQLTFVSVPAGISTIAVVEDMTGGTESETEEEYSIRVADSFALPPRGGANYDYEIWAKEATAVTNVWTYGYDAASNPHGILLGDVLSYFMMYDTYEDGIPEAGDVSDVQAYIDALRPKGMGDFTAAAPTKELLPMSITIYPNTAEVQADVTAQLTDFLRREAYPNGTLRFSQINAAISRASSLSYHTLTVPAADVTPAAVENIFSLGTLTWS